MYIIIYSQFRYLVLNLHLLIYFYILFFYSVIFFFYNYILFRFFLYLASFIVLPFSFAFNIFNFLRIGLPLQSRDSQLISQSADRQQILRFLRVVLNLVPEVRDMDHDRILVIFKIFSAKILIDLHLCVDTSRILHQEHQNPDLCRRDLNLFSTLKKLKRLHIDLQLLVAENLLLSHFVRSRIQIIKSAESSLYPCHNLQWIKRLHQIIIRPEIESEYLVTVLFLRRQYDDRKVILFPHLSDQLKPIHLRHHDIKNSQIHLLLFNQAVCSRSVLRGKYPVALIFKVKLQHLNDIRVILRD